MDLVRKAWLMLMIGIVFEVAGTTLMRHFAESSPPLSLTCATTGIIFSYFLVSRSMEVLPMGITYSVWSGVGLGCISLLSWFFFNEAMPPLKLAGIALVILGMIVLNTHKKG